MRLRHVRAKPNRTKINALEPRRGDILARRFGYAEVSRLQELYEHVLLRSAIIPFFANASQFNGIPGAMHNRWDKRSLGRPGGSFARGVRKERETVFCEM